MSFLKTITLAATLCLWLFAGDVSAHAAALNTKDSEHLKTMFKTIINEYKKTKDNTNVTLVFDGEVESEVTDTHYAITLPHTSLHYTDGSKINIGFITINAKPSKIKGGWSMAIAIPSPIKLINKAGKTAGQINIGKQSTAGIWMEEEKLFLKLDAQYNNITLTDAKQTSVFDIPELTFKVNFEPDENGLWSGPAQLKIKNLKTILQSTGTKISIGEIAGYTKLEKYNPKALKNNQDALSALKELRTRTREDNKPNSPEHSIALLNLIFETMKNSFDNTKFGLKVENISITSAPKFLKISPPETTHIDNAHASFELNNLMQNTSGLRLRTGFTGITNKNQNEITEFFPTDMLLDITLDKIPVESLIALAQSTIENINKHPQISGLNAINLMLKIPAILSAAGTNLEIKQNYITGTDYNIDLNGIIKADIIAVNSATGNAKAIITGLNQFIEKAESKLSDIEEKNEKERLQNALIQLKNIKTFTKKTQDEEGKTKHEIDFIMEKDGKILLNGADISLLSIILGQGNMLKTIMPK